MVAAHIFGQIIRWMESPYGSNSLAFFIWLSDRWVTIGEMRGGGGRKGVPLRSGEGTF